MDHTICHFGPFLFQGWVRASESVPRESYTVRNLKPETTYVFIVRAQNSFGLSEPSPVSDSVETRGKYIVPMRCCHHNFVLLNVLFIFFIFLGFLVRIYFAVYRTADKLCHQHASRRDRKGTRWYCSGDP